MGPLALGAIGAVLGGVAGGQKDVTSQNLAVNLAPETALEKQINPSLGQNYGALEQLINAGAGQQDVSAGLQSQRALAQLLQQLTQSGGVPTQQDYGTANQLTNDIFAPQMTQMNQDFDLQRMLGNRAAARMGRTNDPILLAKLAQEQTRQQQQLGSQMTAFRAEQAFGMGDRRLNYANQLAQVQGGLATQAMANRQALLSLGSQLKSQDQNFRAGTASKEYTTSSGGGMMGALNGAMSMGGAFAGAAPGMTSAFSGLSGMFAGAPKASPGTMGAGNAMVSTGARGNAMMPF